MSFYAPFAGFSASSGEHCVQSVVHSPIRLFKVQIFKRFEDLGVKTAHIVDSASVETQSACKVKRRGKCTFLLHTFLELTNPRNVVGLDSEKIQKRFLIHILFEELQPIILVEVCSLLFFSLQ